MRARALASGSGTRPTRRLSTTIAVVAMLCAAVVTAPVTAQSQWSLRDPAVQIAELFPGRSSHRVLVADAGDAARAEVRRTTGLDLHFSELNRHTLYVVEHQGRRLGFVHVRTERGERGMNEIAYALGLDLQLLDFRIQRSRSRTRELVETIGFRRHLLGRDLTWLRAQLDASGSLLPTSRVAPPPGAEALAADVIAGAVKSMAVIPVLWPEVAAAARRESMAWSAFPDAATVAVAPASSVSPALHELLDPAVADVVAGRDADGALIGTAVHLRLVAFRLPRDLWIRFDAGGRTVSAIPEGEWPDLALGAAVRALLGRPPPSPPINRPIAPTADPSDLAAALVAEAARLAREAGQIAVECAAPPSLAPVTADRSPRPAPRTHPRRSP